MSTILPAGWPFATSVLPRIYTRPNKWTLRAQQQRATGTDGKSLPPGLPKSLPRPAALKTSPVASHCTAPVNEVDYSHQEDPTEQVVFCASVHQSAPHCINNGEGGIRTRETGVNPPDGLANRWFQPLTHLSNYRRFSIYATFPFP